MVDENKNIENEPLKKEIDEIIRRKSEENAALKKLLDGLNNQDPAEDEKEKKENS